MNPEFKVKSTTFFSRALANHMRTPGDCTAYTLRSELKRLEIHMPWRPHDTAVLFVSRPRDLLDLEIDPWIKDSSTRLSYDKSTAIPGTVVLAPCET